MLKIKDKVTYDGKTEIIKSIYFTINANMIEYYCAELEIHFESGNIYYNEITSFEDGIKYIEKRLYEIAEFNLEKLESDDE